MAGRDYEEKYTHPEMREKIKEEIKASDKGGERNQWSARKSQLLSQEYEKRGGGYKTEGRDQDQRNLQKWTGEEWQTREGGAEAREDGETKRYLPKEAWENMGEEEKDETDRRKREGSRQGEQYVPNTSQAKQARKGATGAPRRDYDELSVEEIKKKIQGLSKKEIEKLRVYEERHKNRKTLVEALDRRL